MSDPDLTHPIPLMPASTQEYTTGRIPDTWTIEEEIFEVKSCGEFFKKSRRQIDMTSELCSTLKEIRCNKKNEEKRREENSMETMV